MSIPWENIKIKEYSIIKPIYYREGYACYRALDNNDQKCVIKAFDWEITEDPSAELKAARQLRTINHPNLVRVLKVDKDPKLKIFYYVMELWGKDLREFITMRPRLEDTLDIVSQLLKGVTELHRHNLVHRDIKPENIFIKDGRVKLGDYGLVKSQRWVTQLSTAGTPGYMPPEPRDARDKRWDIYSVGVVLRELLTWEHPPFKPLAKALANIPETLWQVVAKAMVEDPNKRFDSANEFIKVLTDEQRLISKPIYADIEKFKKVPAKKTELSERKEVPQPIRQKLNIQRRISPESSSPIPLQPGQWWKLPAKKIKPNVLVETLQTQLDLATRTNDPKTILEVAKELLRAIEEQVGLNDPCLIPMLAKVGDLYYETKDYQMACNHYSRLRSLDSRLFGEESPEVLSDLVHLAEIKLAQGEIIPSREDYKKVMVLGEKTFGKDNPNTAIVLNNLASLCYQEKKYSTAQGLFHKALRINEQYCDKQCDTLRRSQHMQAILNKRKPPASKQYYCKEHESIAINLYNLGLTYEAQGNKSAAEPLYKQALDIGKNVFKPYDQRLKIMRARLKE